MLCLALNLEILRGAICPPCTKGGPKIKIPRIQKLSTFKNNPPVTLLVIYFSLPNLFIQSNKSQTYRRVYLLRHIVDEGDHTVLHLGEEGGVGVRTVMIRLASL